MVRAVMSSVNRNDAASNILNRPAPDDGEVDFAVAVAVANERRHRGARRHLEDAEFLDAVFATSSRGAREMWEQRARGACHVASVDRESHTPEEPPYEGHPSARGGDTHETTIRGASMTSLGSGVAMYANTSDEHPQDCTFEKCETEAETY